MEFSTARLGITGALGMTVGHFVEKGFATEFGRGDMEEREKDAVRRRFIIRLSPIRRGVTQPYQ